MAERIRAGSEEFLNAVAAHNVAHGFREDMSFYMPLFAYLERRILILANSNHESISAAEQENYKQLLPDAKLKEYLSSLSAYLEKKIHRPLDIHDFCETSENYFTIAHRLSSLHKGDSFTLLLTIARDYPEPFTVADLLEKTDISKRDKTKSFYAYINNMQVIEEAAYTKAFFTSPYWNKFQERLAEFGKEFPQLELLIKEKLKEIAKEAPPTPKPAVFNNPVLDSVRPEFEIAVEDYCRDKEMSLHVDFISFCIDKRGRFNATEALAIDKELNKKFNCRIEADDFCRPFQGTFSPVRDALSDLHSIKEFVHFLKKRNLAFTTDALLHAPNGVEDCLLWHIKKISVIPPFAIHAFFDPSYWQFAPDVLREISDREPLFKPYIDHAFNDMKDLPAYKKAQKSLPPTMTLIATPVKSQIVTPTPEEKRALFQSLRDQGESFTFPTEDELRARLEEGKKDAKLWRGFGDDIMGFHRDFSLQAGKTSMAYFSNDNVSQSINAFLKHFAVANEFLSAYTKSTEPSAKLPLFGWLLWQKKQEQASFNFTSAISLTKGMGDMLVNLGPVFADAVELSNETLDVAHYIATKNAQIEKSLSLYIKTGEETVGESCDGVYFTHPAPHTIGLATSTTHELGRQIDLMKEIHTSIQFHNTIEGETINSYERLKDLYKRQSNHELPQMAKQVLTLHRTFDLLQSAANAENISVATTQATEESLKGTILAAQNVFTVIGANMNSTRSDVLAIQQHATLLLDHMTKEPETAAAYPAKAITKTAARKAMQKP